MILSVIDMEKPIRVFWYCEKWQPGGIQTVQMNLMDCMDTGRIQFDIVVSEDDTDIYDERIRAAGARKIVSLDKRYESPGKRTLANIFAVRKMISNGRYDVVHFNVCHAVELIYVFWAWLYRVPLRIVHCRNNDIGAGGRSRRIKILAHNICKKLFGGCMNVRLANSDLAAVWLFGKKKTDSGMVRILLNGIEPSRYVFDGEARDALRRKLNIGDAFVMGHVGHFNYQKNHSFLLRIFSEVRKLIPDAVLLLVGVGEGESEARSEAEVLGIADSVIFFGVTDDVPGVMWAMDVFVFPSRFEGFGNVLIEAQAAGLKCFASKDVIPSAVRVCDNLRWISLDDSPAVWAAQIAEAAMPYAHEDHSRDVTDAGYTIEGMARNLERLYMSGNL